MSPGADDLLHTDWCIAVEQAEGNGDTWRYTPRGGYEKGVCD